MRDIAAVILNHIQYVNIISGLEELKKCGYTVDIYCSTWDNDSTGMNDMFDDIALFCKNKNYNIYREPDPNIEYKILLEPYPCLDISAKYKIKYRYSNISAKPNIVYKPENYIMYDAILCSGDYDSNYLSVFSKTYKTANLKYENFKKSKIRKSDKKQLLYLPTYGEESSIEQIIDVLDNLRENYYVIAKIHHGTNFLVDEHNRIDLLKNKVDELHDSRTPLTTLLETTDIILTDNSGSIFEGIFTEIPVAVFCDDINKNKSGDFNTTQYELFKEGILPFTNNPKEIINILQKAQSDEIIKKQAEWNRNNFYHPKDFTLDFVNVIKTYINEDFNKRYYQMHNILKNSFYPDIYENRFKIAYLQNQVTDMQNYTVNLKNQAEELQNKTSNLQNLLSAQEAINIDLEKNIKNLNSEKQDLLDQNQSLLKQLNYYESGALYRLAKKIYKLKNGE